MADTPPTPHTPGTAASLTATSGSAPCRGGKGLTPRQEDFCRAYAFDPSATRAAVAAGYSPATARQQGSRLLTNVDIADRVAALRAEVAARHAADTEALIAKLEAVFRRAYEHYQFHAAARAVALQAHLAGLLPARALSAAPPALTSASPPALPAGAPAVPPAVAPAPPPAVPPATAPALPPRGRPLPDAGPRLISGPCAPGSRAPSPGSPGPHAPSGPRLKAAGPPRAKG